MSAPRCLLLLPLMLLGLGCPAEPEPEPDQRIEATGPLVGAVDSSSAALWVYPGDDDQPVTVRYRAGEDAPWVEAPLTAAAGGALRAKVKGLAADTPYTYELARAGATPPGWSGGWRTAAPAGVATKLRLALASCMDAKGQPDQPSWSLLLAEAPDRLLLLGDNVYSNTMEPGPIWNAHLRQRRVSPFAEVIRQVPTVAIWDDHDYGPNDSAGDLPGKSASLRAFGEVWANPGAGTTETPGIFFQTSWGDVDLFALDVRYHRTHHSQPDGPTKGVLGAGQLAWLREALSKSTATFKLIASGSMFFPTEGRADTWASYETARQEFFDLLRDVGGSGLVLLSGDLHACKTHEHAPAQTGLPYPLLEIVSSGIARGDEKGFAILSIDTTVADPTLSLDVILGDGSRPIQTTLKASELR